jgi:predicted NUDIX family phosphoesterase
MEFVFVVPREELFPDFYPQGWMPFSEGDGLFTQESFTKHALQCGYFVERSHAERTPGLQQIIPYGIVTCDERVLLVERSKHGGEARLHNKLSIGIGGHINPVDAALGATSSTARRADAMRDLFNAATRRELEEELSIDGTSTARAVGILNDDSNPVGAVHVGLVQWIQVRGEVRIREEDQLSGEFVTVEELRARLASGANFETWSQLLVENLDDLLPHPKVTLA